MKAFAFLENIMELLVSAPLLDLVWIAAVIVILVEVLSFLAWVVLAILESLLESMAVATVLVAMVLVATILILSLMKSGEGAAEKVDEDGDSSRADIEAGDMEWTVGGDECSAGDAVETDAPRSVEEESGRPVTATGAVSFEPLRSPRAMLGVGLLFFVAILLVVLDSLLERKNWTIVLAVAAYGVGFALVWAIGVEEDDGFKENDGDGCPSGTVIETGNSAWTLDGDGCPVGDAIETGDAGPVTAAGGAVPFELRRSPTIAARTQTRVEPPRRSPRISANQKRANSLRNVGLQPRRSARIAAARLTGGV